MLDIRLAWADGRGDDSELAPRLRLAEGGVEPQGWCGGAARPAAREPLAGGRRGRRGWGRRGAREDDGAEHEEDDGAGTALSRTARWVTR